MTNSVDESVVLGCLQRKRMGMAVTCGFVVCRNNPLVSVISQHFNLNKFSSLKGQSNEIFHLQFFSSFEPALTTDQWVKIFSPGYDTPGS